MTHTTAPLVLDEVAVARGARTLITGLSAELTAGTLAVISGPNGAGKSSLLRVLAGFAGPEAGTVTLDGHPVARLLKDNALPIAYYGHADGLKADLTVADNLRFYRRLYPGAPPLDALAREFGLEAFLALEVRRLSAGQRRRVALSRLALTGRPIWILDEPYTNLDAAGRDVLDAIAARHLAADGTLAIATHLDVDIAAPRRLDIGL